MLYSNTNFNFLYFSVINCEIPATIWCLGCSKCFSHSFIHLLISSMALVLLSSHLSALILQTLSSLHITEDKIIEKDLFSVKFIISPSSFSHINFPLFHFYLSVCFIVPKIPSFKSAVSTLCRNRDEIKRKMSATEGNHKRRNGITQQGGIHFFALLSTFIPFLFSFHLLFFCVLVSFHCPLFVSIFILFTFDFFSSAHSHFFLLQIKTPMQSSSTSDSLNIVAGSKDTN